MARPRRIRINKKGFTLIEIVLALLVVTIGIVAITGVLGTSLDTSAKSHNDLDAVSFADMVFNYYQSLESWNDIPPSKSASLDIPDYGGSTFHLKLDLIDQFNCRTPGFGGSVNDSYKITYLLHAKKLDQNIKALTLEIWPGYDTNGTSRTFYTELYDWTNQ
jgi:prepilin-type N-terminal cleavage/methylation domain-containing protein